MLKVLNIFFRTKNEMTFNSTQDVDEELLFWPTVRIEFGVEGLIFMHVLTMCISIPGNILVITIISKNKTLQDEAAYLLICSVSCADLLVALIAQPLNIAVLSMSVYISTRMELIFYFSIWGFCGASAFGVVAITIDRCLYILYPMHYTMMLSQKRTIMLIMLQWACGIMYGVLPIIDIQNFLLPTAIASLVTLLAMTACMSIIYNKIYKNICRLKEQKKSKSKRRQTNATGTIALIVFAFFVCWFPYIITNFINAAATFNSRSPIRGLYYWFLGLGCWNSALNVVIYGFKNSTLKTEARKLLRLNRVESSLCENSISNKRKVEVRSSKILKKISEPVLSDLKNGQTAFSASSRDEIENNTTPCVESTLNKSTTNKIILVKSTEISIGNTLDVN